MGGVRLNQPEDSLKSVLRGILNPPDVFNHVPSVAAELN
jgi:hypothetical protein